MPIRRFGRRRRRIVRRPRRGRRVLRRRSRVGRAKSAVVRARYRTQNVFTTAVKAGQTGWAAQPSLAEYGLNFFDLVSAGVSKAAVLVFRPTLQQLTTAQSGDNAYTTYASIYDQVRVLSVTYILTPPMGLMDSINIPVGTDTLYPSMLLLPQRYPDVSWFDFDNAQGLTSAVDTDGDYTANCLSRWGAKQHRFGRTIRRTLYPRGLQQVMGRDSTFTINQQVRHTYQQNVNNNVYMGDWWLAVSYKGAAGTIDKQPEIRYSIQCIFKVLHRMPLYG